MRGNGEMEGSGCNSAMGLKVDLFYPLLILATLHKWQETDGSNKRLLIN
jgi:hypothetical protein